MEANNSAQQKDEIEALSSIYGSDWKAESDSGYYFSIELDSDVKLYITLNSEYPSNSPPTYQLLAPSLKQSTKLRIKNSFEEIYLDNIGGPVLYQWIESLREIIYSYKEQQSNCSEDSIDDSKEQNQSEPEQIVDPSSFNIIHGQPITDRKSTFQGHFCEVKSLDDVRAVKKILLQNKKINQATHNISAYRIKSENGSLSQDCDDDDEHNAGGRLMHLLQILDVTNVLVVVSRWYGGIQLGPDRFRHINNAARLVLTEAGVIPSK